MKSSVSNLVNIENLCNAVVERAAEDYSKALCDLRWATDEFIIRECTAVLDELERFFTGEDILAFTKLSGIMLMEKLQKRAEECGYSWNKIRKERSNLATF